MVEYVERVDYDCRIRVRFGSRSGSVRWFVVQLEYNPAPWLDDDWKEVARFDHQPDHPGGHDVYEEGLHVDLYRADGRKLKLHPEHGRLQKGPDVVCRRCKEFLRSNYRQFRAIHRDGE